MKVLLLGFGKIAYMPYMNFYLDTLKDVKDLEFELIYWDRDGKSDAEVPERISKAYKFEAHLEEQLPFKSKLKYFIQYRKFALSILNKNRYDKIIVLHTTPGLTIGDYLIRKYSGRYVLDFRDVSYEYISVYRFLVSLLSKNSWLTFVSSNAFRKFLPKRSNIYTIHNYLQDSLSYRGLRNASTRERKIIRISFWGLIRHFEINRAFILALGNDPRFELHYFGRMQESGRKMEQFSIEKGYDNVFFHGQYMPNERYEFAKETDLIHNIYENDNTMGNAMGNKYYDGIIFKIPQICTINSYMGNVVDRNALGININPYDNYVADTLWTYYNNIVWEEFQNSSDWALKEVFDDQNIAKERLLEFISSRK